MTTWEPDFTQLISRCRASFKRIKPLPDASSENSIANWIPYCRRPESNTSRPDELSLEPAIPLENWKQDINDVEKTLHPLEELHELGRSFSGNPEALQFLITRMKKAKTERDRDSRVVKLCRIIHVHFLADRLDEALALIRDLPECRRSGWGEWRMVMLASEWFTRHPASFTAEYAVMLFDILHKQSHPQKLPQPILEVGSQLIRMARSEDRLRLIEKILTLNDRFKRRSDQSVTHAAIALGAAELADRAMMETWLEESLSLLEPYDGWYSSAWKVADAVLRIHFLTPLPELVTALERVLRKLPGYRWEHVNYWELMAARLFQRGDQTTIPALVARGDWPEDFLVLLKRSWRAESIRLAPRPLEALLAFFDDAPASPAIAAEQVTLIAECLATSGETAVAGEIRMLAND